MVLECGQYPETPASPPLATWASSFPAAHPPVPVSPRSTWPLTEPKGSSTKLRKKPLLHLRPGTEASWMAMDLARHLLRSDAGARWSLWKARSFLLGEALVSIIPGTWWSACSVMLTGHTRRLRIQALGWTSPGPVSTPAVGSGGRKTGEGHGKGLLHHNSIRRAGSVGRAGRESPRAPAIKSSVLLASHTWSHTKQGTDVPQFLRLMHRVAYSTNLIRVLGNLN